MKINKPIRNLLYFGILILVLLSLKSEAHSGKPKYHIIIDTDGAIDDMRSISMLLASNDVRVLGVIGSQGSVTAMSAAKKSFSLLEDLHHEGIPVGLGSSSNYPLPAWNSFSEKLNWGSDTLVSDRQFISGLNLLEKVTEGYPDKIILVCLGSLTDYAEWLSKDTANIRKIEKIIWYNNTDFKTGFNYKIDSLSYKVIENLKIPLDIVSLTRKDLICNQQYINEIKTVESVYAKQVTSVLSQKIAGTEIVRHHFYLWDDMVALYISNPLIFSTHSEGNITDVEIQNEIPYKFIMQSIESILVSGTIPANRVFNQFPTDSMLYNEKTAHIEKKTLKNFGLTEWKSIVLTNEIHGHIGIYSIIGAKMGIRAREYFNVGENALKVTSYAGKNQPLSCLNDGIQISTGATLGQGLIEVSDTVLSVPTAVFEFNRQRIQISLKENFAKQIESDIQFGVQNYQFSANYWIYIENQAYKYWETYDRYQIFNIEKL